MLNTVNKIQVTCNDYNVYGRSARTDAGYTISESYRDGYDSEEDYGFYDVVCLRNGEIYDFDTAWFEADCKENAIQLAKFAICDRPERFAICGTTEADEGKFCKVFRDCSNSTIRVIDRWGNETIFTNFEIYEKI